MKVILMNKKQKLSLTSIDRMQGLIDEARNELESIEPKIAKLEKSVSILAELKDRRHKLKALILNLQSIFTKESENIDVNIINAVDQSSELNTRLNPTDKISIDTLNGRKIFIPEVAISNAQNYLRTKNNINYEIYKAVVANTGTATSEEIKYYLVKNEIKQPKNGEGFEDVPLKEISSRINYLVRKGLLISYAPGAYSTAFGWEDAE
jgi:hypothetical protein